MDDGTKGATLPLLPLFQAFNLAILDGDELEEADETAAAGEVRRQETEAAHWAR
jgi:hypothetical protein